MKCDFVTQRTQPHLRRFIASLAHRWCGVDYRLILVGFVVGKVGVG